MVNKWYGWAGKVLEVNLTTKKIVTKPLTKEMAFNFLGGRGFNAKVVWDKISPGIDPLSPENVLCLAVGPLNGTAMPLSGRFNITCKSPLTGILGDGNAGGYWAPALKFAGYDQIVIYGKSEKPVYLWINDDDVELKDASHLWGTTTWESEKILHEEHGKDVQVCGIGQAGENLVRTSTTIVNLFRSGTPGSGAVWGSKKLKAIVVRGTKSIKIADPEKFLKLVDEDKEFLLGDEYVQGSVVGLGTPGFAPYWYWPQDARGLTAEEAKSKVGGEKLQEMYTTQLKGCYNCLSPCGRYFNINTGKYAGTRGKAPEAATIITMGFYCGNLDLASILKLNNLCNQYGLNTYPAGDAIQLAMALYEKGVITKKDTDGLALDWGNEEAEVELVHKMALREGFGNKLAEGPYIFSKMIGKGAENMYSHNYGYGRGSGYSGLPMGLLYMTSTRGADHLRGVSERYPPSLWKKRGLPSLNEEAVIIGQHEWVLADCLERCKCSVNTWSVGCPNHDPLGNGRADLLSAATGWDVKAKELDILAERIYNVERSFNIREGARKKHDWPPWKSMNKLVDGHTMTTPEEVIKLLNNYYDVRGWDINSGIPTRKRLQELGLDYVADEIESGSPYADWTGPVLWSLDKYPHQGKRADIL